MSVQNSVTDNLVIDPVGYNTLVEQPLSAAEAAKYYRRLTKESVSIRTLYRWMEKGRSGVRLQYVQMAGKRFTSRESMDRFFNRCAEVDGKRPQPLQPFTPKRTAPSLSMRERQIEKARQNLIARGIITSEAV